MKKNLYSHKITYLVTGIGFALLPMEYAEAMSTQIQTDSTLSGISAMAIDSQGGNQIYTLSEINGKTVGGNLFYSFSNFSIGATDTAWFNLNTPDLSNVISRVTGGAESIIDGHLQMTNVGSAPSFFFINPAGVTFGAGASIDVPGSFYVSTASGLNMSDGSVYAAHEAQASTLSAAEPESFGFLGNESRGINLSGLETDNVELTFKPGTDVGLIGNNIQIKNATIKNIDSSLSGLEVLIQATGNESTNIPLSTFSNQATSGNLIIQDALINASSGDGSGHISIYAEDFSAVNSVLVIANTGNSLIENGQEINVHSSSLDLEHTILLTVSTENGNSGNINVTADSLQLLNQGAIKSITLGKGNSGDLTVSARKIVVDNGNVEEGIIGRGNINSITSGQGGSGIITIDAEEIVIDKGDIITDTYDLGRAGDVIITTDLLQINHGTIGTRSQEGASGEIGNIEVSVNRLEINHEDASILTATTGQGSAGGINIKASNIIVKDKGFISSTSFLGAEGNSGNMKIVANHLEIKGGNISTDTVGKGNAGNMNIDADIIYLSEGAISSDARKESNESNGAAGSVTVNAEQLEINNGRIASNTNTDKDGGSVFVSVEKLEMNNAAAITSITLAEGGAGSVKVSSGELVMNHAFISTLTANEGNAGNVFVTADSIIMNNNSRITSLTLETGNAGAITIQAKQLEISNASKIDSETSNAGNAGSIALIADILKLNTHGSISSSSLENTDFNVGDSGTISINAKEFEIDNGAVLNVAMDDGDAGDILITADSLSISNGGFVTSSVLDGAQGNGGNINIHVKQLGATDGHIVNATFGGGDGGEIMINADTLKVVDSSIDASARETSNGQAGDIEINVQNNLELVRTDITIANEATSSGPDLLNPSVINIKAKNMHMNRGGVIATSWDNIDAGSINLAVVDTLNMNSGSVISTEATNADGGEISVRGGNIIFLRNSAIATSVFGEAGNGGNINISSNSLIMDSGFIQANTAAVGASGGDVNIKVPVLVPSGGFLQTGGNTPFDFQPFSGINVIQAAAPDGVSGTITAASPQLNLSGVLTNLVIESFDSNTLSQNMCAVEQGSSLYQSGKGGLRMRARDFLLLPVF